METLRLSYKEYIIGQRLRRFPLESFCRYGDINALPNTICYANYFSPRGTPIDVQAEDMSMEVAPDYIEPEDIVQYVYTYLRNPFVRKIKPTYEYEEPEQN